MDVFTAFHFGISIDNHVYGFKKVSGIARDIETHQYQEGGCNDYVHIFPKPVSSCKTLSLEKGVSQSGFFPFYFIGEHIESLTLEVRDRKNVLVKKYMFHHLIVTKWEVQELNATDNGLLIDQFELQYEEFTVVDISK